MAVFAIRSLFGSDRLKRERIQNLTSAIAGLTAAIDSVEAKLNTPPPPAGVPEADVQAAADAVKAQTDRLVPPPVAVAAP